MKCLFGGGGRLIRAVPGVPESSDRLSGLVCRAAVVGGGPRVGEVITPWIGEWWVEEEGGGKRSPVSTLS